jgi:hypothetical protein
MIDADLHRLLRIPFASLKTPSLSDLSIIPSLAEDDFSRAVHTPFNDTVGSLCSIHSLSW